jgi:hypothetical protein
MYKDKDKQRQAVREATRRYRAKNKDSALSDQKQRLENAPECPVMDDLGDTQPVIPSECDTRDTHDVIPCDTQADRLSQELEDRDYRGILADYKAKPQSFNPMMVGYTPPKE